jgi:hypothetical protein
MRVADAICSVTSSMMPAAATIGSMPNGAAIVEPIASRALAGASGNGNESASR